MATIIIPRKHLRQPQGRVAVTDEYAHGIMCMTGNAGAVNMLRPGFATGVPVKQVTPDGLVVQMHPNSTLGLTSLQFGINELSSESVLTFFYFGFPSNQTNTHNILGIGTATANWALWLRIEGGANLLCDYVDNPVTAAYQVSLAGNYTIGKYIAVAYRKIGNTQTLFNGVTRQKATQSGGNGGLRSSSAINFGSDNVGTPSLHSQALLAYATTRYMGDDEVGAILENPWQLFRADPIRIYSFPSGPVGISWSSLTASNMTPTTATLTIGGIVR